MGKQLIVSVSGLQIHLVSLLSSKTLPPDDVDQDAIKQASGSGTSVRVRVRVFCSTQVLRSVLRNRAKGKPRGGFATGVQSLSG